MIEIIAIVMLLLWLTGIITSNTLGGFIHLLLVVAVVMFLVKIIQADSSYRKYGGTDQSTDGHRRIIGSQILQHINL
jgi:Ca2+/Na+ antiporter